MVLHPRSGGLLREEGRTWCKICGPPLGYSSSTALLG